MKKILSLLLSLSLLLTCCAALAEEAEEVGEPDGLPAYVYEGDDPIEGAVMNYLAADDRSDDYLTESGCVNIPCAVILKTDKPDDTHATVYGDFWILNYVAKGQTLECISGGEYPGIITLELVNGEWEVTGMEEAGDGEDYVKDIQRFAGGDAELEQQYYAASDMLAEPSLSARTRFIKQYVETSGLDITAYKDEGWDPVPLN